MPIIISDKN